MEKQEENQSTIDYFIDTYDKLTKHSEEFLIGHNNQVKNAHNKSSEIDIRKFVKDVYDYIKSTEQDSKIGDALPELIIENLDEEQIWQEIELQNNDHFGKFSFKVTSLKSKKDSLVFPLREKEEKDELNKIEENKFTNENDEDDIAEEDDDNDEDYGSDSSEIKKKKKKGKENKKQRSSIVDDNFFKLSEMEEFLLAEEKREEKDDESEDSDEEIDYFEDIPSDEDEEGEKEKRYKYKDFFAAPWTDEKTIPEKYDEEDNEETFRGEDNEDDDTDLQGEYDEGKEFDDEESYEGLNGEEEEEYNEEDDNKDAAFNSDGNSSKKKVSFKFEDDLQDEYDDIDNRNDESIKSEEGDDDYDNGKIKSTMEMREERLKNRIKELEEEAVSEKPWQMKGEISASSRPQNSLLEEVLEFDMTVRPAPVMTEVTTERLEDIIIRRIKDKVWDDVQRKVKPVETVNEFKKRLILDQEKSKRSLAEIYEQEFIKQRDSAAAVGLGTPEFKEPEESPEHKKITSMMVSLFGKLDALSNFHYTPQIAAPELKIVNNLPAITMEEVAPITATDATLLAPEEVLGKKKMGLLGKEERTGTDRKRERRKKKKFQQAKHKLQEKRLLLNENKNEKYTKEKATKELKELSNSRKVKVDMENQGKHIKTSTAFFNKLQDDIKTQVNVRLKNNKRPKDYTKVNAKKLKL